MTVEWLAFSSDWLILGGAAFFAGMVDAVVGGGGLIQIPVLLSQFPQTAIPTLFGTNKVASIVGTSSAMVKYGRSVAIPWRIVLPATAAALVGAWLGAALVAWLPREWMRPLVLVLMVAAALYTFANKHFGHTATHEPKASDPWLGALVGLVIGLYDGFFGPGTGSFLIFAFIRLFGMDFLRATAGAKVVNVATNLSAIAFFSTSGPLLWSVGIAMAACNLIGAQVGTFMALRHGSGFIRKVFLVVVVVLIGKLALDVVRSWAPGLL
ncbi:MAG: sulfite exporter TauE/SafE family protein [Bacteroidota bacterium]